MSDQQAPTLALIRRAVADYMRSEGCSCCRDGEAHQEHKAVLATLLRVKKYPDGSGYDFGRYETMAPARKKVRRG